MQSSTNGTDGEEDSDDDKDPLSQEQDLYTSSYYKVWSDLILTTVIPLIVLITCNLGIFVALRRSRKSMSSNRNRNCNNGSNGANGVQNNNGGGSGGNGNNRSGGSSSHSNDHGLALILVGIVLVFVICHSLRFFLAFYRVS